MPLAVWLAQDGTASPPPVGVWLDDVTEGPEAIATDSTAFAVIGVNFPKFTDGRGYSTARLLRERYGYTGELRAIGDVLHDQLFLMALRLRRLRAAKGWQGCRPRPSMPLKPSGRYQAWSTSRSRFPAAALRKDDDDQHQSTTPWRLDRREAAKGESPARRDRPRFPSPGHLSPAASVPRTWC